MSDSPTTTLSERQCWDLLASQEFGRLAYHLSDEVHIAPVNYAVDRDRLVFRTAEGSKLLGVVMDSDVAFEIDQVDDDAETAWSVVARGTAGVLEGQEAREVDNLRLRPWVGTEKFNVVAITITEVSGRKFALSRPWRHLRRHG
ncbi:pyridoxamine 5'-phosphate oxidase family protein [uncultured Serinicoccus sp.]|uniref:pyridoxamine 5'-phosphate oxidase family protein n=1 Tax=uncultured Serinicoccus sp. TaxID=735514 RepID=UPI0026324275|nr:pyridoxamine 5'-phosphate oxidase family protein [uncultured Serinicoccus sp.]